MKHQPTAEKYLSPGAMRSGALGALGMALFYVVVVAGASGSWTHLTDQGRQDWYYLLAIIAGFGTQVALLSELRRRQRLQHDLAAAGGTGAGASTVGMVACCAHHLADLIPFIGATGAAAFLIDYRIPFMVVGIGVNVVGITIAARRLGHTPNLHGHNREDIDACVAA